MVSAAWASVLIGIQLAMLGGIWTIALMLGSLRSDTRTCMSDIAALEKHQQEHDQWHLERFTRGVEDRRRP